tara:strand:- start:1689 stop:2171 length:483 start_codon:yes stop_codon:yes gene_type:complete
MDLTGFHALEIEPATSYEPLPSNWYKCVITDTEKKPTKAMTGSYLQLTIEVIEGEYQGRKVFDRLNLDNPNSVAVQIAQSSLSSVCRSINVNDPQDSIELRDKPLMVKISVKPADGQYGASNEVKGYEAALDVVAAVTGAPVAVSSAGAAGGVSVPPWKR